MHRTLGEIISNRLLSQGLWVFGAKVGTGILQVIIGVVLARILSPIDFGVFQILSRVIVAGGIVGAFGMDWTSVRLIAEGIAKNRPDQSYIVVVRVLTLVLTISLLVGCAWIFFGDILVMSFFGISMDSYKVVIGFGIVAAALQSVIPECFRGFHEIRYSSIFSGLATNSLFLLGLLVSSIFITELSIQICLWLFILGLTLAIAASGWRLVFLARSFRIAEAKADTSIAEMLKISTPILLTTILIFITTQADVWFVAAYVTPEASAYYAAASRLIFILTVPLMVANAVIKPIVVKLWASGERGRLERMLKKVANITFLVSLIPSIFILVWPELILSTFYGHFYVQGASVMRVLALGQVLILMFGPCSVLIVMVGRQSKLLFATLLGSILFCILSLLLINKMGELGIAISVVLGALVTQALIFFDCWRYLGVCTAIGLVRKV